MNKLSASDLLGLERYARERAAFRTKVLEHKRARQLAVGPHTTWLFEDRLSRPMVITKDVRHLSQTDLKGFDAVVHLAELSNDPLGENDPAMTLAINHQGSVQFARTCKSAGVNRFVYASS